ncbi:LysM peptidoglycan-binding domain-containing protein [Vallitalea sp.]|jgi:nucleoid-associated protein YgaU|uniref:LysM peptidoglycan-binding domain-containing protein n=1 Tax=Vallitalea sp. TaxID=1882829 RepID=UPI0025E661EB|nr:LysM peptidoglycan-binding domain-containing protein [Vallitalea sp.]MCT4687630.1 LysM peptidoglycan-binding domain-containing protein [Vallitalea sp.]
MKRTKKVIKKAVSLMLLTTILLSQSVSVHAGFWDKVKDTVKDTVDDAKDWTENAVDDAKDWTENAVDDAKDWTENAVDDAKDWTENAVDDATDWTKNAIEDVSEFMDDVLKNNPELSELDLLPVLNMDVATATNVLTSETGTFIYGDNVKEKKLPLEAEKHLKKALKDIGLTEYWSNFVITEVSETSGNINIGEYVANLLPYSFVYGDKVADAINDELEDYTLVDIDPYKDGIVPSDTVDGMDFTYTIKGDKANLQGNYMLVITGLKYGVRDDFTVTLKLGDIEIPTEKRALNKEEVAFVASINNADANELQVIYKNEFEKPADIAFEIADGIQDGINSLVPFGDPISNSFRDKIKDSINDIVFYMEDTKKDKNGNAKTNKDGSEKKEVREVSINDVLGDGDVGVIITDMIYKIPGLGGVLKPILKLSGGDDKLSEIIRDAIGQAEVKSFAKLQDGKIYIKSFDTIEAMQAEIQNSTSKSNVDLQKYKKEESENVEANVDEGIIDTLPQDNEADKNSAESEKTDNADIKTVMPTSLVIKQYDTVGNISLRYYGDYSMKQEIYNANKDYFKKTGNKLNVGDTLVLPEPAKYLPPVEDENTKVYVVKAGDTLAKIAKQFYKDASAFNKIVEANQDVIKDVNKIYEGQVLAIPVK